MLRRLSLRDFVIVTALEIELDAGFTVLTGETGAGKSILVDALQLALGSRGDAGVVREGAARAEIVFENDMSSAFRLRRIVALYDGAPLATKTDERDQIGDQKEIPLYAELVQPGDHTVQVLLEYQGNGYGIFSYLKGYKFEVRSSRSFTAIEGKTLQLRVVGYEQGGPTTPLEERPAVRFVEKVQVGVGSGGKK